MVSSETSTKRGSTLRKITVLLLTVAAFAAKKPPLPIYSATLTDFNEERYNESHILDNGMHSCVNRDYTIETETHIVVLRQSTCFPNRDRALQCVIGQSLSFQQDGNRVALLDSRGKQRWFKVFKITKK